MSYIYQPSGQQSTANSSSTPLPPKTDIWARAYTGTGTAAVSAEFSIVLVRAT